MTKKELSKKKLNKFFTIYGWLGIAGIWIIGGITRYILQTKDYYLTDIIFIVYLCLYIFMRNYIEYRDKK